MSKITKNEILVTGGCIFREVNGKMQWFIVKEPESNNWEIPKTIVRKGESSVRAILRIMGEKGGMSTRVLEEAGRAGGVGVSSGKTLPQRVIYYLMISKKMTGDTIGFSEFLWTDFTIATKKLFSKREKVIFKAAKDELKEWQKRRQKRRLLQGLKDKKKV
jgi:hypothetical protein